MQYYDDMTMIWFPCQNPWHNIHKGFSQTIVPKYFGATMEGFTQNSILSDVVVSSIYERIFFPSTTIADKLFRIRGLSLETSIDPGSLLNLLTYSDTAAMR